MPNLVRVERKEWIQQRYPFVKSTNTFALRLNAVGEYLTRTTNLPPIASFTLMAWFKISVDRDAYSSLFTFGSGSSGSFFAFAATTDGTTSIIDISGVANWTGVAYPVGKWFHGAITVAGTGSGQVLGYKDGVLNITGNGSATPTALGLAVGDTWGYLGQEPLNGCIANILIYSAALSRAEILRQMNYAIPLRRTQLNGWYPMLGPWQNAGRDYSGNGNNMTVTGTLGMEQGPALAWAPPRRRRVYKVAGGKVTKNTRAYPLGVRAGQPRRQGLVF